MGIVKAYLAIWAPLLVLTACASGARKPTSELNLKSQVREALSFLSGAEFSSVDCPGYLNDLAPKMRAVPWDSYNNDELSEDAVETMNLLWKTRLALHKKLGQVDRAC